MPLKTTSIETRQFRCAAETIDVAGQIRHFPKFTHKWSRHRRSYRPSELILPERIFVAGQPLDGSRTYAGIGGTRSPSVETFVLVSETVQALASLGLVIISGGVPGVDLAAHLAALNAPQAATYAVLANPAERGLKGHEWHNDCVETAICRSGGFLSEYTEDAPLFSDVFLERLLQRDRIISGFCDLFVVFECRENSATVDTAKRAMLQGKLVAAVESSRRTIRVGIEQLVDEHKIPRFRSGDLTPVQIAAQLAALVGERSKGSTPSPVADSRP